MTAILNNQIQPVSETRLSSLTMTSVLSHWFTAKPFVLSLYKCDTTRMVGRPVNSTTIYTSLLISLTNTSWLCDEVFFLNPPKILPSIPSQPKSSTYIYTASITLIPHIYPHNLHLINPPHIHTQPSSH